MPTAMSEMEFLVRSSNRVGVLEEVDDEPRDRTALQEALGVSRVTLGRILGDLENRRWIRRTDAGYTTTALGELVVEDFSRMLDTLELTQELREIVAYLPVEELDIPIRHLTDAAVGLPTEQEPIRYLYHIFPDLTDADHIEGLWPILDPDLMNNVRTHTDGETTAEFVFTREVLERGRETGADGRFTTLMENPGVDLYEYDGTIPLMVLVIDGTAFLLVIGEVGHHGVIKSDDPVVLSWAERTIRRYREQSSLVDLAAFEPGAR